jgi:carotenoid cleavage dioxygenase
MASPPSGCRSAAVSGDRSDVVIFNARDFGGAPVATLRLPVRIPYGFHGGWVAEGSPVAPVA